MVGIVAVFVSSSDLVNPLTYHLLKRVALVSSAPFIHQIVASAFDDAELLVNFSHQKEPPSDVIFAPAKSMKMDLLKSGRIASSCRSPIPSIA